MLNRLLVRLKREAKPAAPFDATTLIQQPQTDAWLTRTAADEYALEWRMQAASVHVFASATPDALPDEPLAQLENQQRFTVSAKGLPSPVYFHLQFSGGDFDGKTLLLAERELPFEKAKNFRDLGGYRTEDGRYTRWGKVYRAGALADLTSNDLALMQMLNIQLVCDLRTPEEMHAAPDTLPDTVIRLPLSVDTHDTPRKQLQQVVRHRGRLDALMVQAYTQVMIDRNAHIFGEVLRRASVPENLPLVFHCTAGKDRTGIAAALLLRVLGVPQEVVVADYTLSNRHFNHYLSIGQAAIRPFRRLGVSAKSIRPLLTAPAPLLEATLAYIAQEYTSVESYLIRQAGIPAATFEELRQRLLQP